jgi:phosphonate transport system substrate-binding protein
MKHICRIFFIAVYICTVIIIDNNVWAETETPGAFIIGLIPERNIFKQLERYTPLAGYLSKKTGLNIELKILTRYGNIIDNFVSADMDAAFFGSFTYALAHEKIGVDVIARPESFDNASEEYQSSYFGIIFTRKDAGIKTAKDMKGKVFVFVDRATTAGYLLPLAYFKENQIHDYNTWFKETYFAGTHQDAIFDVLNKKADIGAAKNTIFFELASKDSRLKNDLVILKTSPLVPENALAVKKGLDSSIKKKLQATLINMHADPEAIHILKEFGATRFIETSEQDYENVYRYADLIGLDLSTYNYMNK